eukprot:TRINITY_DN522_c0_g1_i1.p1 TRINITY_DN522_c0_g1~~TRINITY_DN522_c0_g1_i1.p1  ORF type:complete len:828 (+),score=322.04 TRINITY_DN522_c0_g1_i1:61-2484(+)
MARTAALLSLAALAVNGHRIGVGKSDATSSLTDTAMMGYAQPNQKSAGLHTRLYARAFVVADDSGKDRAAFVSLDSGMPSVALRNEVDRKLRLKFLDGRYHSGNVMISGTHSHSGPGGYFEYFLFQITSLGFVKQTFDHFTDAVVDAIVIADKSLQPGAVRVGTTKLPASANINRSPTSYLENPAEERAKYPDGDTDKDMVQLRFDDANGKPVGIFNWFAIHGTALNNTNTLVSGDSRGIASQRVEQKYQTGNALPGQEDFVAAFASTNLGDVSPNTDGQICHSGPDEGKSCDIVHSTCPVHQKLLNRIVNRTQPCYMLGPGKDMYDSARIQAQRQTDAAEQLIAAGGDVISGPVGAVHQYINMSGYTLRDSGKQTCSAALGYSFAGGTVDGPGDFDFRQHMTKGEPFWDILTKDVLDKILSPVWGHRKPNAADYACHSPKPVLLFTGMYHLPWHWHPDIVEVQLIRIGDFFIAGVPGEFTTMSGRRFRAAIEAKLQAAGVPNAKVVIAGLSNQYTHYIATPEEYTAQRYEAASTLFGQQTLPAYIQAFGDLADDLAKGVTPAEGKPQPTPPLFKETQIFPPKLGPDGCPSGKNFGDVLSQPANSSKTTPVRFSFIGANIRIDPHAGGSFFQVQRRNGSSWVGVANDGSDSTKLMWENRDLTTSELVAPPVHDPSSEDVDSPMRHIWGPMLNAIGQITGRTVSLSKVQQCIDDGKKIEVDRIFGSSTVCSLYDITKKYSEDDHPVLKHYKDLSLGKKKVYSAITLQWEPAVDQAAAGEYRFVYNAEYMAGDKSIKPYGSTSSTFTLQ